MAGRLLIFSSDALLMPSSTIPTVPRCLIRVSIALSFFGRQQAVLSIVVADLVGNGLGGMRVVSHQHQGLHAQLVEFADGGSY